MDRKNVKDVQMRIGNLEVRTSHYRLPIMEIVQWDNSHCWTVANWQVTKDGAGYLSFVSDRPFAKEIDLMDFWRLAKLGQEFVQEIINESCGINQDA